MGSLSQIELNGIRVDQEAELDAECLIWREVDLGTISKVDASFSSPTTVNIYSGPCSCSPIVARRDRFDVHGEQQVYQNQYRILVPWDAGQPTYSIKIGDYIRITTSEDDDFLAKDMTIKDVLLVSDISLRRLTAIDIKE
ncbi:MAG: DUF6093 family protein [Saprospiraceae bacterium]|nr:DUF6093 family protein [Saprospiraceae bacterium]